MIVVYANDYENLSSHLQGVNLSFSSLSAARMKEERVRLGLKQASAAQLCGVSREIWGRYERGASAPGGDVLFSFAAAGADVQFILTGKRQDEDSALIDVGRLERITEMLEVAANQAGKRWPVKKLTAVAAEIYNILSTDRVLDEHQVHRVLKLVVNR
ncbi:helix-turn-helix domain-containing protein [Pseudomonas sp. J380]|uniref:helix-turn-helix domain-containing protein n=1 Tax=Pseudomonas sp. J380 TaxID=2605424 RepID=UPI001C49C8A4|nr:helix-turn-helix transcriptional regulator [Pseudomonas sp. J380]